MNEAQYTQAIHKHLPAWVYKWKILDSGQAGVPDAFYRALCDNAYKPLWVEYKLIKALPKRSSTLVLPNLSKQQQLWLQRAYDANEQVLVILGVESEKSKNRGVLSYIYHSPKNWTKGEIIEKSDLIDYKKLSIAISNKLVK